MAACVASTSAVRSQGLPFRVRPLRCLPAFCLSGGSSCRHHTKDSSLSAKSQRLVVLRGGKKATIAVGHTLLVIIYQLLSEDKDYEELGGNSFDEWDRQEGKSASRTPYREAGLPGEGRTDLSSHVACCL
jgi:hypothetical protein